MILNTKFPSDLLCYILSYLNLKDLSNFDQSLCNSLYRKYVYECIYVNVKFNIILIPQKHTIDLINWFYNRKIHVNTFGISYNILCNYLYYNYKITHVLNNICIYLLNNLSLMEKLYFNEITLILDCHIKIKYNNDDFDLYPTHYYIHEKKTIKSTILFDKLKNIKCIYCSDWKRLRYNNINILNYNYNFIIQYDNHNLVMIHLLLRKHSNKNITIKYYYSRNNFKEILTLKELYKNINIDIYVNNVILSKYDIMNFNIINPNIPYACFNKFKNFKFKLNNLHTLECKNIIFYHENLFIAFLQNNTTIKKIIFNTCNIKNIDIIYILSKYSNIISLTIQNTNIDIKNLYLINTLKKITFDLVTTENLQYYIEILKKCNLENIIFNKMENFLNIENYAKGEYVYKNDLDINYKILYHEYFNIKLYNDLYKFIKNIKFETDLYCDYNNDNIMLLNKQHDYD